MRAVCAMRESSSSCNNITMCRHADNTRIAGTNVPRAQCVNALNATPHNIPHTIESSLCVHTKVHANICNPKSTDHARRHSISMRENAFICIAANQKCMQNCTGCITTPSNQYIVNVSCNPFSALQPCTFQDYISIICTGCITHVDY